MNKLIRLSPTGIEYGDYTWNFVSGCGNNIDGKCKGGGFNCWAYSIAHRFKGHYPNDFNPTIYPEALLSPLYLKKPSKILCAFMGDLFGDWFTLDEKIEGKLPSGVASISMSLKAWIFSTIKQCPQHTFLFLTKKPQNLPKWSPFPDNCWVGFTAINTKMFVDGINLIYNKVKAKVIYVSLEPLLEWHIESDVLYRDLKSQQVNWIIIGACTGTKTAMMELCQRYPDLTPILYDKKWTAQPKIEWIEGIVQTCDKAGVKAFLKDNLKPLLINSKGFGNVIPGILIERVLETGLYNLRQEVPE